MIDRNFPTKTSRFPEKIEKKTRFDYYRSLKFEVLISKLQKNTSTKCHSHCESLRSEPASFRTVQFKVRNVRNKDIDQKRRFVKQCMKHLQNIATGWQSAIGQFLVIAKFLFSQSDSILIGYPCIKMVHNWTQRNSKKRKIYDHHQRDAFIDIRNHDD